MTMTKTLDPVLSEELQAVIDGHAEVVCKTDEIERVPWLLARKPFIGGSEAASTIGLGHDSRFSLYVEKTTELISDEDNEYMKWGRRLEEAIGYGIAEDTGIPVARFPYMMRSREWPWAAVNVDFLAGPTANHPACVVEVKNVSTHMAHEWDDNSVPRQYGIQGQHACAVLGLPGVHFFPLIGGHEGRPIYVERNDSLIEKLMEGERQFWELVENLTPPEIDGSPSTTRALKALFADPDAGSKTELPEQSVELIAQRAIHKAAEKEHKEAAAEIENQLYGWMGNFEIGQVNGTTVMTWKKTDRAGYSVAPTSYRRIHIPKPKKK